MSKRGRKVRFHGAFKTKTAAIRKERAASNRYILPRKIKGHTRYLVLSRRER